MRKYALLFSGGVNDECNDDRYAHDLSYSYQVLSDKLGFEKSDIHVLYADGTPINKLEVHIDTVTATKESFKDTISTLAQQIEKEDLFFLLVTNHGDNHGDKDGVICTWGEERAKWLSKEEVENTLNKIHCTKVILMGQCYGGDYTLSDVIRNAIIMSANQPHIGSYAKSKYVNGRYWPDVYDEFVYHFMSYYNGAYPAGEKLLSPSGSRAVAEAFAYAKKHDSYAASASHPSGLIETPCIKNNLDKPDAFASIEL
jgi:hypothetical protein